MRFSKTKKIISTLIGRKIFKIFVFFKILYTIFVDYDNIDLFLSKRFYLFMIKIVAF